MAKRRLTQAINDAYAEEMTRDPKVILFGEDVETSLFGDTRGLLDRFGRNRIRNTPISETALTGMAVGAALSGYRVICHLMFSNFLYTGFDAIANQAAKMRLMTGGQARLPVTYFCAYGAGTSTAAQHSDSPYALVMNLGGINVAAPATPADAKGLMKSAIRGDNPTVFFMPRTRGGVLDEVPDDADLLVPFGRAAIRRPGTDVTVVAIGPCVQHALRAAESLAADGVSAEVIDPRTLVPLDMDTVIASVERTGRLVIVDESRERCSAASQIAAMVGEQAFGALRAPIVRVATPNMSVTYAPQVERMLLPDPDKVIAAVRQVIQWRAPAHRAPASVSSS